MGRLSGSTTQRRNVALTIDQGAKDDGAFTLRSSDVAHALLSVSPTDVYMVVQKHNNNAGAMGGARFFVLGEDNDSHTVNLDFSSYGGTPNTAKTTAGFGLINFNVYEHDGAGSLANATADGNVFSVRTRVGGADRTCLLVDEDGDLYSITAAQTFDLEDDLDLVDGYDRVRSGQPDAGRNHEQRLIDLGVLGGPVAEGGMTNKDQLVRLMTGAIRELKARVEALETI